MVEPVHDFNGLDQNLLHVFLTVGIEGHRHALPLLPRF